MSGVAQGSFSKDHNDGSGPSSSNKRDTAKKGGKNPGPEWQFATNISRYIDWKCNICNEIKSGGAPRIRDHFLGGNSRICGGKCKGPGAAEVSTRLRAALDKTGNNKKLKMSSAYQTPLSSQSNVGKSTLGSSQPEPPPVTNVSPITNVSPEFQVASTRTRQVNLVDSFRATALEEAQLALAKAIYFTGGSLAMVNHEEWKTAWKKIGEYGPTFTPPTYHHMRNQLLDKCYTNTQQDVERLIINAMDQSGCTIVSDGWSNVQRRPLINIMVVSPRGECFIKAVDSAGEIKSGFYIASIISDVINEIGEKNVIQVVMDNAANCRAAGRILEQRYPKLYTSGCNTHSLNLVLHDWYKSNDTEWFKTIIDKARRVVKFILKRQRLLDLYRQRMSTMIRLPCETRFATNFYMVESLLRNKSAVMETFVCGPFSEWEASQSEYIKVKILSLRENISSKVFWDDVGDAYHVMMPIIFALRQLDSRAPNIGKVYMAWWSIQESLKKPEEPQESFVKPWKIPFNKAKRETLGRFVHARWIAAHSPLHSAAFLLDPEYWAMDLNELDEEVLEDFYDVISRWFSNSDEQAAAVTELTKYKLKEGRFSMNFVQKLATEQPAWKWWLLNGGSAPLLRRLAIQVLAQCASNSSSERNWSTYKYVHSTCRNRLLSSRADKLVYLYCNNRLVRKLESDDYNEEMPKWAYDVSNEVEEEGIEVEDLTNSVQVCSTIEIEENLALDESLQRSNKRRCMPTL